MTTQYLEGETRGAKRFLQQIAQVAAAERKKHDNPEDFLRNCKYRLKITYPETFLKAYWYKYKGEKR